MSELNLSTLEQVTQGRLRLSELRATSASPDVHSTRIRQIATDSRYVCPADVFWALRGELHDGANFVPEAFRQGAIGIVTQSVDIPAPEGRWILEVDDSLAALQRLAAWKRSEFAGQVVAITGSVAKSTTREMLNCVLRQSRVGIASPRSFNNHVGLPLSMLELDRGADYALFELGASRPGEIDQLAGLCRPQVGIITSAGDAHFGTFGGYEAIARAKCELLARLPSGSPAILNGDCPRLRRAAAGWKGRTIWFGRCPDADVMAAQIEYADGRLSFRIGSDRFEVPVWGRHHLVPTLAAIAAARALGATTTDIARGLASFESLPHRSNVRRLGSITVIDDSYNASPAAMQAALALLRETATTGRKIAVLGEMLELGEAAASLHRLIGELAANQTGADMLVACGTHAQSVAEAARSAGMPASRVHSCQTVQETWRALRAIVEPGDVVLFKASRAIGLERVVAALEAEIRDVANGTPPRFENTNRTFGAPSLALSLREFDAAHPPG